MLLLESPAINKVFAVSVLSLRWHNTALTKLNHHFERSRLVKMFKI
jgi:hypothetical protein